MCEVKYDKMKSVKEFIKYFRKKLPEYEEIEELRLKKQKERGGFDQRIILKGEK